MNKQVSKQSSFIAMNWFETAVIKDVYEAAKGNVKKSDATQEQYKKLTLDVMEVVGERQDYPTMVTIAKYVKDWEEDKTIEWKRGLCSLARNYENIKDIYVGETKGDYEVIIVVQDVLCSEVLAYNDFCFELMEDFQDIKNFSVFDEEEYEGMKSEYVKYSKLC